MANVLFKKGLQAALPKTGAISGSFYLTTDTHRLYIGNDAGGLDILTQSITTVATLAAFESGQKNTDQFYYIIDGNMLLYVNDGGVAIQLNKDTYVASSELQVTGAANKATIANVLALNNNTYCGDAADEAIVLQGAGGVSLTTAGKTVTVSSKEYTLGLDNRDGYKTAVTLKTGTTGVGTVNFTAGSNGLLTVAPHATNANTLVLTAASQTVTSISATSKPVGGYTLMVENSDGSDATCVIDPIVAVGNRIEADKERYHFNNNIASLPVYTITEVDNLIKDLDAMTYKGTVSSSAGLQTIISANNKNRNGDTYKVAVAFDYRDAGGTLTKFSANDMIILNGSEGATGFLPSPCSFDHISSGAGSDTLYRFEGLINTASGSGITLVAGTNTDQNTFRINKGDNWIGVTGTETASSGGTGEDVVVTVTHANVTRADGTATVSKQNAGSDHTITVLTALTSDAKGHVTKAQATNLTIKDTILTSAKITRSVTNIADNSGVNLTLASDIADQEGGIFGGGADEKAVVSIRSTGSVNITAAAGGAGAVLDIVWGSF